MTTRPSFIEAGSYTAKALDQLEAAIAANDNRAVDQAFQNAMRISDGCLASKADCDRMDAITEYLDGLLEAHYGDAA